VTTILILDDNSIVLQMLGLVLRAKGEYQVLEATTEEEAVSRIERHAAGVDLLVADVCVEDRPGRAIAGRLAAICPELRLLFISGYPKDDLVEKGWLQPEDAFLAKPFTPERLMRSVNEVLAHACPAHTVPSGAVRTACAGGAA
jgi:two-component system, cell cycle sensor histidine kinase and response regulator CckA